MSIRELLVALCAVEDAIRQASLPEPSESLLTSSDGEPSWDGIGALAADEQRIVLELRRRRLLASRLGFESVDRVVG